MTDLYADLGVDKAATGETIRAAHRKHAKRFHPDNQRTGDRGQFDKIQRAYLVLRDPVSRERYDQTGDTEQPMETALQTIARLIVQAFDKALNTMLAQTGGWKTSDLTKGIVANIESDRRALKDKITEAETGLVALEDIRKRLRYTGKENDFLGATLTERVSQTQLGLQRMAKDAELIDRALVYAKDYGYEFEQPSPSPYGQTPGYQDFIEQAMRNRSGFFHGA